MEGHMKAWRGRCEAGEGRGSLEVCWQDIAATITVECRECRVLTVAVRDLASGKMERRPQPIPNLLESALLHRHVVALILPSHPFWVTFHISCTIVAASHSFVDSTLPNERCAATTYRHPRNVLILPPTANWRRPGQRSRTVSGSLL